MKIQPTKLEITLTDDQITDIVLTSLYQHLKYCQGRLNWHGMGHPRGVEAASDIEYFNFMINYYGGDLPETGGI